MQTIGIEALIEKSKDKFCPLVTSSGIFSITSNLEATNVDITIGVQKFNSDLNKNWTDNLEKERKIIRLKLKLPLHVTTIKDKHFLQDSFVKEALNALAGRFAVFDSNTGESYEIAFIHSCH